MMKQKMCVALTMGLGILMLGSSIAQGQYLYNGGEFCISCHAHQDKQTYYDQTLHPRKVQGPQSESETSILTTMIYSQEVSIFDPRTEGYSTYIEPWADYFNEPNVVYTIGSHWKQRFMTQLIPDTVDGTNYSGQQYLTDNDYVVMGIMWNVREQKWMNYHGPTNENNWYTDGRLTRKKCGGCHTTGFEPVSGIWADQNNVSLKKGVSCESCHGLTHKTNPAEDFTFKQQLEMCGACHGRGVSVGPDGGPGQYGFPYSEILNREYRPGDNLADFYIQTTASSKFWPNAHGGNNGNAKSHHEQYNDFLYSAHVDAEVGCIECHTSHTNENPHQTRRPGNDLCTHCHTDYTDPVQYRSHSAHNPDEAKCIDCHMPYTAKTVNAYDIRSHTFKITPPAETIAEGSDPQGFSGSANTAFIANSCNSSCHNGTGPGPVRSNAQTQMGLNYIRTLQGKPPVGDLNHDGIINNFDFAIMGGKWLDETSKLEE